MANKPKLRGIIHAFAFFKTSLLLAAYLISSFLKVADSTVFAILTAQFFLYGISSVYHIFNWSQRTKKLLQRLDHTCIHICISATHTSIVFNIMNSKITDLCKLILVISWILCFIGVIRSLFLTDLNNKINIFVKIIQALVIVPVISHMKVLNFKDTMYFIIGGIFLLCGGIIFFLESPNPISEIFEYHELFHLFSVLGNLFGLFIIIKSYINLLDAFNAKILT